MYSYNNNIPGNVDTIRNGQYAVTLDINNDVATAWDDLWKKFTCLGKHCLASKWSLPSEPNEI